MYQWFPWKKRIITVIVDAISLKIRLGLLKKKKKKDGTQGLKPRIILHSVFIKQNKIKPNKNPCCPLELLFM